LTEADGLRYVRLHIRSVVCFYERVNGASGTATQGEAAGMLDRLHEIDAEIDAAPEGTAP
jgi:hypothetical protein